jgi:SSS family solute:Na+ symporter
MDRMGVVFLASLALAVIVSLATPASGDRDVIEMGDVSYATRTSFNVGALAVILSLVALYATWW